MNKISKDAYWLIYRYCSVADWGRSRRVCKRFHQHAEHLDIVRKIFKLAGCHSSEKWKISKPYVDRIFEHLRFSDFLDNPQAERYSAIRSYSVPFSWYNREQVGFGDTVPLARAGRPECCLNVFGESARLVNCETGEQGEMVGVGRLCWPTPFRLDDHPRLAALKVTQDGGIRVALFDLNTFECVATKHMGDMTVGDPDPRYFRSLVYFADAPTGPELIVALPTRLIRLSLDNLDTLGSVESMLDPVASQARWQQGPHGLYVWRHQLLLDLGRRNKLFVVNLEMQLVDGPIDDCSGNTREIRKCEIGDRNYWIVREYDSAPRVLGYKTPLDGFQTFLGGRWGDHDYVICGGCIGGDPNPSFWIWRDDDKGVKEVKVRKLLSLMPKGSVKHLFLAELRPSANDWPNCFGRIRIFLSKVANWTAKVANWTVFFLAFCFVIFYYGYMLFAVYQRICPIRANVLLRRAEATARKVLGRTVRG